MLKDGTPVYYTKISKFNPDLRFSKLLIDSDSYKKLKNRKKPKKNCWDKFWDGFFHYYCCIWDD